MGIRHCYLYKPRKDPNKCFCISGGHTGTGQATAAAGDIREIPKLVSQTATTAHYLEVETSSERKIDERWDEVRSGDR